MHAHGKSRAIGSGRACEDEGQNELESERSPTVEGKR